jgi:hypothetical protein
MYQRPKDNSRWPQVILVGLATITFLLSFLYFLNPQLSQDLLIESPDSTHLMSNTRFDCHACEKPNVTEPKLAWEACLDRGEIPRYYLSVVIVTRSDDYASDQRHRLQNMIDSTYILATRTRTKMELLIVEWNPAIGRQRIQDIYR